MRKTLALGAIAALVLATAGSPALATDTQPSLTGKPGDPKNGRAIAIKQGGCLSCHVMPIPEEADHGHIGPELIGVADRLSEGEIRFRVVDPKRINPETIMPAFHKSEGLHRVAKGWEGKPILTAEQVEDVVAYLVTLKEKK